MRQTDRQTERERETDGQTHFACHPEEEGGEGGGNNVKVKNCYLTLRYTDPQISWYHLKTTITSPPSYSPQSGFYNTPGNTHVKGATFFTRSRFQSEMWPHLAPYVSRLACFGEPVQPTPAAATTPSFPSMEVGRFKGESANSLLP